MSELRPRQFRFPRKFRMSNRLARAFLAPQRDRTGLPMPVRTSAEKRAAAAKKREGDA
jgi:hypothetical protein